MSKETGLMVATKFVPVVAMVLVALALTGCTTHWDKMADQSCEAIEGGDAFDRASAERLCGNADG